MLDTKTSFDKFREHLSKGRCLWDTIHFYQFRIEGDRLTIIYDPEEEDFNETVSLGELSHSIEYRPANLSFKSELFKEVFLNGTVQVLGAIRD